MDIQQRIDKFLDWCEAELIKEKKELISNRAYIANENFFERIRIKPLIATARLIEDLCKEANIMLSVHIEEKFKRIKKFGKKNG